MKTPGSLDKPKLRHWTLKCHSHKILIKKSIHSILIGQFYFCSNLSPATLYSMKDIYYTLLTYERYNESYISTLLTWITTNANINKKEDKIILEKLDEFKISTQCVSLYLFYL